MSEGQVRLYRGRLVKIYRVLRDSRGAILCVFYHTLTEPVFILKAQKASEIEALQETPIQEPLL